jgi:hypothetical protein
MASWNEEGYNGGGFLPSTSSSLDDRKRQLLQWLAGRGATQAGFRGSAVGRMGGIGGKAPLPALSYNPFFAQIAGRQENFPFLPGGVSSAAAQAVQQGPIGPGMGLVNSAGGGNIGGAPMLPDAAPGVVQQPQGGFAGRNLIGVAPPSPPVQSALSPQITGAGVAPALSPYDPYALARAQSRGSFRM